MYIEIPLGQGNNFFFLIDEEFIAKHRESINERDMLVDTNQQFKDSMLLYAFGVSDDPTPYPIYCGSGSYFNNISDMLFDPQIAHVIQECKSTCHDNVLFIPSHNNYNTPSGSMLSVPNNMEMYFSSNSDQVAFKLKHESLEI